MSDSNCGCKKIDRTVMYITAKEISDLYIYSKDHPEHEMFNLYFSVFGFGRELEVEIPGDLCKRNITDYNI